MQFRKAIRTLLGRQDETRAPASSGADGRSDSQKALRALTLGIAFGLVAIPLYALQSWYHGEFLSVFTTGIMLAGASLLMGGILGFLFGIPRSLQQEDQGEKGEIGEASGNSVRRTPSVGYRVNTNLEQISDWLTKILVGVGLTQMNAIPGKLKLVTQYAAAGMGSTPASEIFCLSVLLYFSVLGFLFGYLWTRLFLAGALRQADLSAIGALESKIELAAVQVQKTEQRLDEFKKQADLDARALSLSYRQLGPSPGLAEISQQELNAAIAAASRPIKVQIFNNAWQVRRDTWRDEATKPKMERTIPIFRALIENDPEGRYHMNHGQLGFALKDKPGPDWAAAKAELSEAIEIRGPWGEHGWLFYEYNRAVCTIMTDDRFLADEPSTSATRDAILDDLRAAMNADLIQELVKTDQPVAKWMKLNKIHRKDLEPGNGNS